ncbi:hypothetical protein [Larkinella rosea]|uniref:Uncharacterized protein n=1 Tax=Larkinella rosea TaxID=2025312 RepID=A0A3P1C025_9BACT|nr:hypothetical protein [Larkinella rosea]RRB06760.1 hypothetical protein EHT25_02895 [Larkinella rosea]
MPKVNFANRTFRYWCAFFSLVLASGFLAFGSGYMAYELTRESFITLGSAGIGFYVMYYLGSSFFPIRSK